MKEVQAANVVRRVIARIRVCSIETHDELQAELLDTLEKNLDGLGSLYPQVQEECETAIESARTRVEQLIEAKSKEEAEFERPVELIKEMGAIFELFKEKVQRIEEASAAFGGDGSTLSAEEVPAAQEAIEEYEKEVTAFQEELKDYASTKGKELQAANIPLSIKKDWFEQISRVGKGTQESKLAIARAKAAIHKVRDSAKKELFDKAKVRLLELLESSPGPAAVADAEKLVVDLEAKAEPFTRFKKGPESEMMPLADQVDSSAEAAKASVASAKELLRPVEEDVFDEMIKADVQAFLSGETRRSEVRLGQLGRRIDRCTNLSSQYRSGLDKYRIVALIEELKPLILQKVKDSSGVDVEEVAAAIKEAEKQVELSKKVATLSMEEAIELSDKMEQAIEAAKASMAGARQQLCPIDESLDPVVQKALKAFVAAEVKGSEQKLGLQEMKLRRVVNLNTTFRADIAKKKAAKVDQVRTAALKIIRLFREGRSLEDLFGLFEPGDGDLIDESKFLTFFEKSDTMLKAIGVEPPTEEKPSAEELAALFASSCPEGSSSLTKDSFISLVAAYLQVVKKTNLTEGVSVMKSAVVRDLVVGELLEVIDGPTFEEQIKVNRLKVKAKSDGAIGWATMAGNAGTVFLKEHKH
eukprot:CAMPEP_0115091182 /NCGR_PEP_ID=MMETSP0227-20121206/25933_1 /TAXON_ID=89957 /ORGANISM="Polarella glacialis, Strain CCMP 1383" /LENGTH=641 /DNA_ID=CAMNT_0002482591 /DNA_START=87 /DNA_END=2012 /DNA_ORIENTATION=+